MLHSHRCVCHLPAILSDLTFVTRDPFDLAKMTLGSQGTDWVKAQQLGLNSAPPFLRLNSGLFKPYFLRKAQGYLG